MTRGYTLQTLRHHVKYLKRVLAFPSNMKQGRKAIQTITEPSRTGILIWYYIEANGHEAILTLVDRLTGYSMIERLLLVCKAKSLSNVFIKRLRFLKSRHQLHSITMDNGFEFSDFERIERRLGIPSILQGPTPQRASYILNISINFYDNTSPKENPLTH